MSSTWSPLLHMLEAHADRADWREISGIVLHIDAEREPDWAWRAFDNRLAHAQWMTEDRIGGCCGVTEGTTTVLPG